MKISLQRVEVFDEKESYKFLKKVLFSYTQYLYAVSYISPVVYMYVICPLKRIMWLTHIGKRR
jgi:hypothetical protein